MPIFLVIYAVWIYSFGHRSGPSFPDLASPIHEACLQISRSDHATDTTRALLCNDSIALKSLRAETTSTGIYHLLLFSGVHLLVLEECCRRFSKGGGWGRALVLFLGSGLLLMGGAQVRVLRALASLALEKIQNHFQLRWTEIHVITASGLAVLPFATTDGEREALLLGWTASLAVRGFSERRPTSRLKRQVRLYLLLAPCLLPLALPHPLSILVTLALAPVFLCVLLPSALLEFALPPLHPLFERLSPVAKNLMETLNDWMPAPYWPCPLSLSILAGYLALLTLCAEIYRRRELGLTAGADDQDLGSGYHESD